MEGVIEYAVVTIVFIFIISSTLFFTNTMISPLIIHTRKEQLELIAKDSR